MIFLVEFIFLSIKSYFKPFLLDERGYLGFNNALIGFVMIFAYIGSILGYYSSGILSDKFGKKKIIYLSASIYFIFNLGFVFLDSLWGIYVSLFGINICYSIFMAIVYIYAVEFFSTNIRSTGSGWIMAIGNSVWIFGNLIIYYFLEVLSLNWGTTFLILSILPLLLILLTYQMPETTKLPVEKIYQLFIEEN